MKNQETLEEVANEYSKKKYSIDYGYCEEDYYISFLSFRAGVKWNQERSYSEEDMREAYKYGKIYDMTSFDDWLEQFKKK